MRTFPVSFSIWALAGSGRFWPTAMTLVTLFADIYLHTTCPK
jgi:hypothetical protein